MKVFKYLMLAAALSFSQASFVRGNGNRSLFLTDMRGSFKQTCSGCYVSGDILKCKRCYFPPFGEWRSTSIDIRNCPNRKFQNFLGFLACEL